MPWQRSEGARRVDATKAKSLIERYCAYQERCHSEVRSRLLDMGIYGLDLENLLAGLIESGYLNEERFARSYASGKFAMKNWGRQRIIRELKSRHISEYCIRQGLSEIDEQSYQSRLQELLEKELAKLDTSMHPALRRQQLISYAQRKGYEWANIESALTWLFHES